MQMTLLINLFNWIMLLQSPKNLDVCFMKASEHDRSIISKFRLSEPADLSN
jgi:hypothetical protein